MSLLTPRNPVTLLTLALAMSTAHAHARTEPTSVGVSQQINETATIDVSNSVATVSGRLALGLLNGDADELVFDSSSGAKISHLEWQIDNVAMLGAGVTISPKSWLRINGDIWLNISDGSGSMDDYDWSPPITEWTFWSSHENTDVEKAIMFDFNADLTVLATRNLQLFGILGFKHDFFEWESRGGSFVYSINGFRNVSGTFSDDLQVISYEQTYSLPYIGLGFEADYHPFGITGRIIGSTLVDVEAEDTHHLRNLVFEDNFETGSMIAFDLGISYHLTKKLRLSGGLHYQDYEEVKGSTVITDTSTGISTVTASDTAGADNSSTLIELTISYTF